MLVRHIERDIIDMSKKYNSIKLDIKKQGGQKDVAQCEQSMSG